MCAGSASCSGQSMLATSSKHDLDTTDCPAGSRAASVHLKLKEKLLSAAGHKRALPLCQMERFAHLTHMPTAELQDLARRPGAP